MSHYQLLLPKSRGGRSRIHAERYVTALVKSYESRVWLNLSKLFQLYHVSIRGQADMYLAIIFTYRQPTESDQLITNHDTNQHLQSILYIWWFSLCWCAFHSTHPDVRCLLRTEVRLNFRCKRHRTWFMFTSVSPNLTNECRGKVLENLQLPIWAI